MTTQTPSQLVTEFLNRVDELLVLNAQLGIISKSYLPAFDNIRTVARKRLELLDVPGGK